MRELHGRNDARWRGLVTAADPAAIERRDDAGRRVVDMGELQRDIGQELYAYFDKILDVRLDDLARPSFTLLEIGRAHV